MPSKTDSRNAQSADFDLDNYFLEGDLDDDPFASPKPGDRPDSGANKRKEPGDGLGIDEEVSVAKKARVPRVKLDQDRLLSQKGIPALRKRARDLKLKGKGHEWGDASRLLSFYQEWLDDLFPKAKFLDALAMVEKTGHNKIVQKMRVDWINEGRPKDTTTIQEEEEDRHHPSKEQGPPRQAQRIAPIFENAAANGGRLRTPEMDDIFGDDIYNATPIGAVRKSGATDEADEPDEDELDVLMAEAEGSRLTEQMRPKGSLFGDGKPKTAEKSRRVAPEEPEEEADDLDALLAEAEAEGLSGKSTKQTSNAVSGDEDDLDALMAEAEAEAQPAPTKPGEASAADGLVRADQPAASNFNDEEEAMAEMDGLW